MPMPYPTVSATFILPCNPFVVIPVIAVIPLFAALQL
jgi:hypothetical protein